MIVEKKIESERFFQLFPMYFLFFKNQNFVINDFSVLILKKWFHLEPQPTKADLLNNTIYIKGNQINENDKGAWLVHELAHLYFFKNKGVFFDQPYPKNIEEEFAFSCQFLFLKEQGINMPTVFSIISKSYSTDDFLTYQPVLRCYWENTTKTKIHKLCL